jgi:hypothetical protein
MCGKVALSSKIFFQSEHCDVTPGKRQSAAAIPAGSAMSKVRDFVAGLARAGKTAAEIKPWWKLLSQTRPWG